MRRWLPFFIMLVVVSVLGLLTVQMAAAQSATNTPPAGQTVQPPRTTATPASITAATPTPESANALTTATFTPLAASATATPTASPTALATVLPTVVPDQTYTVVYGDRLAKIAEKFGLTVACIANANSISNPDLIYVGQQLRISANCTGGSGGGASTPVSSVGNPQACQYDRNPGRIAPGDKYTVQVGDSLDFIACDFNVDLQCLKDANPQLGGLSLLKPGDVLSINFSCPIWRDSSLPAAK